MTQQIGFEGKVAIITGAGGGLGRAHALMLASRGALVVVNDLGGAVDGSGSDQGAAERVVAEIEAAGGDAVADTHSVATASGGEAIVQTAIDAFGRIDIVVNNAGIVHDQAFHKMDDDVFKSVLDVHLFGAYHVTRRAWPYLREQSYGRVVSTASAVGLFGNFGQANYGSAKMALVGFTRTLAIEGARHNIKANAIAPLALTRMSETLFASHGDDLGPRWVSPVVAYLTHESCEPTGRIFSVAGGRVAEIFIGEGPGFTDPDLSPESVAANLDAISNRDEYVVPGDMAEEIGLYLQ
jgi:NAD(P)-dependent dehydrogenase (short-subunit alcohol dehydrogenase family)